MAPVLIGGLPLGCPVHRTPNWIWADLRDCLNARRGCTSGWSLQDIADPANGMNQSRIGLVDLLAQPMHVDPQRVEPLRFFLRPEHGLHQHDVGLYPVAMEQQVL